MAELLENGNLKIEAYSFAEFLTEFEQAVINGFTLDLETNENFPQKYGSHLYVVLVPTATELVTEENPYLPPEYVENLLNSTGPSEAQVFAGLPDSAPEQPSASPEVVAEVTEAPKRKYNRKAE